MAVSGSVFAPIQMPSLSVIIPAYNEERNIAGAIDDVLQNVASTVSDVEIIVVDDGSRDATATLVSQIAARDPRVVLITQANAGHGPALINGIARAKGEWLLLIDSDRQVSLCGFAEHWSMTDRYDVILGLRRPRRDPAHRHVISALMRFLLRWRLGVSVVDAGAPYKLLRAHVWTEARQCMRDRCWIPSVLLAANALQRHELRVLEVPIVHSYRPNGPSSLNLRRLAAFCREGVTDIAVFRDRVRLRHKRS